VPFCPPQASHDLDLHCCSGKLGTNFQSYVTALKLKVKYPKRKTKFNVDITGRRVSCRRKEEHGKKLKRRLL
jgi:hypothetical protein